MRKGRGVVGSLLFGALLLLTACPPGVGNLQVDITGLPGGVNGSVTVSGPNSFNQVLTNSQTLTNLALGSYTVTANSVNTSAGSVATNATTYTATVTGSPANVTSGGTATVGVAYSSVSGGLQVDISGLPGGVNGSVTVSGPSGFSTTLTSTQTLSGLEPGSYTISAANVSMGGSSYSASVSTSPAEVNSSTTTMVAVVYKVVPGSLQVSISGLSGGTNADVTVSGPNGFNQVLTASQTLTNLEPGSYTITAGDARDGDPLVSELFTGVVVGSPATVSSGATANATVSYSKRAGTGHLWVPHKSTTIASGYAASQLVSSGSSLPDVVLSGASATQEAIAFDGAGNMWVTNFTNNTLEKYIPANLAASGSPTPAVVISADAGGSLNKPGGLAFDAAGNLWVANTAGNTLVRYTPAQLSSSGSPTPSVTIGADAGGSLSGPAGLAFDNSGNLWATILLNATVVKFTPAQLSSSGSPTPSVTISADAGGSLNFPTGLAFDASGSLWVVDNANATVIKYTPAQLSSSGSPTPSVTIGADAGGSLDGPVGLAFDNSGNLWVTNFNVTTMVKFTAVQLAVSGSPTPGVIISGMATVDGGLLALNPPPTSLPINTP